MTYVSSLQERGSNVCVLKGDGCTDADACKQYQLEKMVRGPCIFSVRRLNPGEPIYRGDKLWRHVPRFNMKEGVEQVLQIKCRLFLKR